MDQPLPLNDVINRLHALAGVRHEYPFNLRIKMAPLRALGLELSNKPAAWEPFSYSLHYELNLIYGMAIAYSKASIESKARFFKEYFQHAEDWSYVDCVAVSLGKDDLIGLRPYLLDFAKSSFPYIRRLAFVLAIVHLIKVGPVHEIYALIDENEAHYHAYMAIAWLLAECFIKDREAFLTYLESSHLALWIRRKMVSKIRDSYRVSQNDKEFALKFRMERPL